MTWPQAFLAVPTNALAVDPQIAPISQKASHEEMSRWMGNVPKIYAMLERGTSDAEFHRMATAPTSPQERELGATYRHLFSMSASAQPLRAELGPDGKLALVAGQHRTRAAQAAAVPLLPVHIAARDDEALRVLRADLEARARAINPAAVDVHRVYDEHRRPIESVREAPAPCRVDALRERRER